jgi:hypothetical protein
MNIRNWFLCALTIALVAGVVQARPQIQPDAEEVAKRCAQHIADHAAKSIEANEQTAVRVVNRVERLLEDGHPRQALQAAKRGIVRIVNRTRRVVQHMEHDCERCMRVLGRLGAPELAERLEAFSQEKTQEVRRSRKKAVAAIRAALPESFEPQPGEDD